jgi:TetR/AcrR family transcriptional regulator, transcriptional repressor for nem operon
MDTRDYIIDHAYKLFLYKSYEAVSISDISHSIGLTKGALYHHFLNKEDLFKAVIDKYLSVIGLVDLRTDITLEELVQYSIQHVKKIVYTICVDDTTFIPVNYLSLLIDALRHYPGYAEAAEPFFTSVINNLKTILDNAVKNGEIREDINTHVTALNFFSISVGITANIFRENSPEKAVETFEAQMFELYKLLKK